MDPAFLKQARVVFHIGEKYDGSWTNTRLMANVQKAATIAMFKYSRETEDGDCILFMNTSLLN